VVVMCEVALQPPPSSVLVMQAPPHNSKVLV
jgi:hypothetical protein